MKIKILSIFLIIIFYFLTLMLTHLFCGVPPGFEVYFNEPNSSGTYDPKAKENTKLDFVFYDFINSATLNQKTTIYAAFYDIDNSTAIAALNLAYSRGSAVYLICDADAVSTTTFNSITTTSKIRTSAGNEVHNKFCVIKDSSVWTGSWNLTNNDTYANNNNVVVIYSSEAAKYYEMEFTNMFSRNIFGVAKGTSTDSTSWNGKTVNVNGTPVKIYFSPYSNTLNSAIINELRGNTQLSTPIPAPFNSIYFAQFTFTDDNIKDQIIQKHKNGLGINGILDDNSTSMYDELRSTGVAVVLDYNFSSFQGGRLHHKFCVIDEGYKNARVITGSANWTPTATGQPASGSGENDENIIIIYSTGIAKLYYEEFQKLYLLAGPVATPSKKAVSDVVVYPSPAKNKTTIGFELSSNVTSVAVKIYTLSGELAKEITPSITPGVYNEVLWNCDNDDGEKVASGLYILKIEATTADKTFFAIEKFAVIKGEK